MLKIVYKLVLKICTKFKYIKNKILFKKIKRNKSIQTDFNKETFGINKTVEKLEIIIKRDVSTQTTLNYNDFILDDDNEFYHLIWTNNLNKKNNLLD